ncbi:unnamed protein product [Lactuca saligna]|uniref:Uncharacterized protein n=1 Tax=Lactuca saligna TaxID=75948 RepID=A0AA35Z474_LACSI|nr:unnamed protein product [Lactuca saligna]
MLRFLLFLFLNRLEIPIPFVVVNQVKISATVGVGMAVIIVVVKEVAMVMVDRSKLISGGVKFCSISNLLLFDSMLPKVFFQAHLPSISSLKSTRAPQQLHRPHH